MHWLRCWSDRCEPLGHPLHLLVRIRGGINPFVIKDSSSGIVNSTRCYAEVSVDDELLRIGFEH